MPDLAPPRADLFDSWHAAWAEDDYFGHGMSLHLAEDLDLTDRTDFATWVDRLNAEEHTLKPGFVTATNRWAVLDDAYLGAIQLRHSLGTEFLRTRGGNVGYTVRASERGKGLASWMLRSVLPLAADRGMDQLLLTVRRWNEGSARVIAKCGGVEEPTDPSQEMRRFWVPTDQGLTLGPVSA